MTHGNPSTTLVADGVDGAVSRQGWVGEPVDLTRSPRLQLLIELAVTLSRAQTADELLSTLNASMRKAYGARCLCLISVTGQEVGHFLIDRFVDFDGRVEDGKDCEEFASPVTG